MRLTCLVLSAALVAGAGTGAPPADLMPVMPESGTSQTPIGGTLHVRQGESVVFHAAAAGHGARWLIIEPLQREYDQLDQWKRSGYGPTALAYRVRHTGETGERFTFTAERYGTVYIAYGSWSGDRFHESRPLHLLLASRVIQVAVRGDDTYLGYLRELWGTPFILPPCPIDRSHQTDLRMGSDCAAFAVYGQRRMGRPVPYGGPWGIRKHLTWIARDCRPDATGRYRDGRGRRVPVGAGGLRPGDIVHFGAQVSVFYEDRGVAGFLDRDDLVMQSYDTGPMIVSIERSSFYHCRVDAGRWREQAYP